MVTFVVSLRGPTVFSNTTGARRRRRSCSLRGEGSRELAHGPHYLAPPTRGTCVARYRPPRHAAGGLEVGFVTIVTRQTAAGSPPAAYSRLNAQFQPYENSDDTALPPALNRPALGKASKSLHPRRTVEQQGHARSRPSIHRRRPGHCTPFAENARLDGKPRVVDNVWISSVGCAGDGIPRSSSRKANDGWLRRVAEKIGRSSPSA